MAWLLPIVPSPFFFRGRSEYRRLAPPIELFLLGGSSCAGRKPPETRYSRSPRRSRFSPSSRCRRHPYSSVATGSSGCSGLIWTITCASRVAQNAARAPFGTGPARCLGPRRRRACACAGHRALRRREFAAAIENGRLARALELYRGDFMPGFYLSGCLEYERWVEDQRMVAREQAVPPRGPWRWPSKESNDSLKQARGRAARSACVER